jgi:hypothetical protein
MKWRVVSRESKCREREKERERENKLKLRNEKTSSEKSIRTGCKKL